MADATERLLAELTEATLGCRSSRLRLAVTAGEYQQIRRRMLDCDGRFYARVRNLPLVIDEHASKPLFFIESEAPDGETDPENQSRQTAQGRPDHGRVQSGRAEELVGRDGNQPQAGDSD